MNKSPNYLGQNLSPSRFSREGDRRLLTKTKLQKKVKVKLTKNETVEERINNIIKMSQKIYGDYDYKCVTTKEELKEYIMNVEDIVAIDTETTGLDVYKDKIIGMSFYDGKSAIYVPINHLNYYDHKRFTNGQLTEKDVAECLSLLDKNIVMHNANFDIRVIKNNVGIGIFCFWDTYIGARILDENNSASLKYWYAKYIDQDYDEVSFNSLFSGGIFQLTPPELCYGYACHDAVMTYEVYKFQSEYLNENQGRGLNKLYDVFKMEMELLPFVIDMEDYGMAFDFEFAQELSEKYTKLRDNTLDKFNALVENLYSDKINVYNKTAKTPLEQPLNISSPLQLQTLLFDIIGYAEHSKYGRSTGVEHLREIESDLTNTILEFREYEKLLTTYIDKLPLVMADDGRVHCDFLQMGTDTGRFCIAEGTEITTLNGSKKIEDIKQGDLVYCYNSKGEIKIAPVLNLWLTGESEPCVKVIWTKSAQSSYTELVCTPDHKIRLKNGEWVEAQNLKQGNHLSNFVSNFVRGKVSDNRFANSRDFKVTNVKPCGNCRVYDIEVETYHNFIANGVNVHNSSRSPNMQNIPSKAKEIRQMFKASDGHVLISSDYSSQEPRILAHMSGDDKMIKAFKEGKDLYSEVASLAFNKPYEECQEAFGEDGKYRRYVAKQIVLGVTYGKGIPAIANDLGITREEAQAIYDKIMGAFPKLKSFMEESKYMAQNLGYVTSMLGRKRRLPNINLEPYEYFYVNTNKHLPRDKSNAYERKLKTAFSKQQRDNIISEALKNGVEIKNNNGFISEAIRQCVNARIQGSAADQTKQALIEIGKDKRLKELGFKLLLVIHDEVIGECPIEHKDECAERLSELMLFAAKDLTVPSKCDTMVSRSWDGEAIG